MNYREILHTKKMNIKKLIEILESFSLFRTIVIFTCLKNSLKSSGQLDWQM